MTPSQVFSDQIERRIERRSRRLTRECNRNRRSNSCRESIFKNVSNVIEEAPMTVILLVVQRLRICFVNKFVDTERVKFHSKKITQELILSVFKSEHFNEVVGSNIWPTESFVRLYVHYKTYKTNKNGQLCVFSYKLQRFLVLLKYYRSMIFYYSGNLVMKQTDSTVQ